jgi:hypothetical protein
MSANQAPNVLLCLPNRINCILLILCMSAKQAPNVQLRLPTRILISSAPAGSQRRPAVSQLTGLDSARDFDILLILCMDPIDPNQFRTCWQPAQAGSEPADRVGQRQGLCAGNDAAWLWRCWPRIARTHALRQVHGCTPKQPQLSRQHKVMLMLIAIA